MKIGDGSNTFKAYIFLKDGMHSPQLHYQLMLRLLPLLLSVPVTLLL